MSNNLMLYIENKNLIECEFEHILKDELILNSNYKCGLLECVIPQDIKVDQFKYARKIYLNMVWIKDFKTTDYLPHKRIASKMFDYQTSENYIDMQVEFKIGPNINTIEEFLNEIQQKLERKKVKDVLLKFYRQRFKYGFVRSNVQLPTIEFNASTGKFQNNIGKMFYQHVKYEQARKYLEESEVSKLDAETAFFYKKLTPENEPIVNIFYTFDEKLHKIMGFDSDKFPNIILKYENNREILIQHNKGLSTRKCVINELDTFYLHSNIVKESFCLGRKQNILQIFQRKYNSSQKTISYIFENPVFIPIITRELNSISFKLTNKLGDIAIVNEETFSIKIVFKNGTF